MSTKCSLTYLSAAAVFIATLAVITISNHAFAQEPPAQAYWQPCTGSGAAQSWFNPTHAVSGTVTVSGDLLNSPLDYENDYGPCGSTINVFNSMDSLQAFIDLTDDNFDSIIGSVNVAATDNMNGYYVWEANGQPAPNAPSTQVFLVSPMQQIYDYSPSGSSEVSSIADSFGSVCVDTNSGTGNTQVPSTDHSYLVNLPVLNGIATINDLATFGMTLSSSGSTTNPWASAYSDVRETMYAQPDTRTVTLHRTGATGETTDLDSTVHGDTIYSTTNYN